MPVAHDHDDENTDATDDGAGDEVTVELEEELRLAQLEKLKEAGF